MALPYLTLALASRAYGKAFVDKARAIAANPRVGMPVDWLLAIIGLETGNFTASGPPWVGLSRNPGDHGGGIIGFTGVDGGAWEQMTPVEQLDFLPNYFDRLKTLLDISIFRSPIEAYFLVRAPWGLLMAPGDTGVGGEVDWKGKIGKKKMTRQSVIDIATGIFRDHSLSWTLPTLGIEGQWLVRIGSSWLGQFVFLPDGYVWYSTLGANDTYEESDRRYRYGHWEKVGALVRWRFGPRDDIRRWEAPFPAPGYGTRWDVVVKPPGQGFAKMWRGSPEPD
jgi:hypothetical protein